MHPCRVTLLETLHCILVRAGTLHERKKCVSNFDRANTIGTPFELPETPDVYPIPFTTAHKLTTLTNSLLREFLATATGWLKLKAPNCRTW